MPLGRGSNLFIHPFTKYLLPLSLFSGVSQGLQPHQGRNGINDDGEAPEVLREQSKALKTGELLEG